MNESAEQRLIDRKIQPTLIRQMVLEHMMQRNYALSLAQIAKAMPHLDKATLYRAMKAFENKGLVHGVDDGTGAVKYALCEDTCAPLRHRDLHLHFSCTQCGETTCLPAISIPEPALPGYLLAELNLVAKGLCQNCAVKF